MASSSNPNPLITFPPNDFSSSEYSSTSLKNHISSLYDCIISRLTRRKTKYGITFHSLIYIDNGSIPVNKFLYYLRFRRGGDKFLVGIRVHDFYVVGHRVNEGRFMLTESRRDPQQIMKCEDCLRYYGIECDRLPFTDDYPSMEQAAYTHKSELRYGVAYFEKVLQNLLEPTQPSFLALSHLHFSVLFGEGARLEGLKRLAISIFGERGGSGPDSVTISDETLSYLCSWGVCSYVIQSGDDEFHIITDRNNIKLTRRRMANEYYTVKNVSFTTYTSEPIIKNISADLETRKNNFMRQMSLTRNVTRRNFMQQWGQNLEEEDGGIQHGGRGRGGRGRGGGGGRGSGQQGGT